MSYGLPPQAFPDPIGGNPTADFVIGLESWLVPDCCRLKVVVQNVSPLLPAEDQLGTFTAASGATWSIFDTGIPEGSTVFATMTEGQISINVNVQSLRADDQALNSTLPSIAESVGKTVSFAPLENDG